MLTTAVELVCFTSHTLWNNFIFKIKQYIQHDWLKRPVIVQMQNEPIIWTEKLLCSFYTNNFFSRVSMQWILRYCFTNSVRPSVGRPIPVLYLKNRHFVKLFWLSGRGIILVFWITTPLQISKRNSLSRGVKYTESWKISQLSFLSQKRHEIGP